MTMGMLEILDDYVFSGLSFCINYGGLQNCREPMRTGAFMSTDTGACIGLVQALFANLGAIC